jgi:kynurenine formamidase
MRTGRSEALASILAVALVALGGVAFADNNPVDEQWWPTEFGPDDEAGATNYITPEKRLAAVQLVKQGKVLTLGMPYSNHMPLVPGRTFALSIPGAPTHGPLNWPGDNFDMTFMDELLTAEIGQVGTQFDGLGHPMIRITGAEGMEDDNYFYNGVRLSEVLTPRGLKKNGTHNVGSFFTRGILIDAAALKGVDTLEMGYAITLADFKAALEAQGVGDAEQGDVVLFRTGWTHLWKGNHTGEKTPDQIAADNKKNGAGEPGVSPEVCDYLAERKISMIGSDTWGLEPYDFAKDGPPESFAYCHMNLILRRGIYNFENLDLDGLSEEKVYEFLFSWAPLKLVGATGAPGNPIAAY